MKLSFKIVPREGRFRTFEAPTVTIKANRKAVGMIIRRRHDDRVRVMFHIKVPTTGGCEFTNVFLKSTFETIDEARAALKARWDSISKYPLHQLD